MKHLIKTILLVCIASAPALSLGHLQEQTTQTQDSTESKKSKKKPLPLKPSREISFSTTESSWMSLDVSPDGNTIVFDLLGDLYTLPITGGKATPLTSGMAFDTHPRFSPDGKSVAYITDASGSENLWIMTLEDTSKVQISKGKTNMLQSADWTPDGDYLVTSKGGVRSLGLPKLWIFHREGGVGLKLVDEPERLKTVEPAVSPDGKLIWFSPVSYTHLTLPTIQL